MKIYENLTNWLLFIFGLIIFGLSLLLFHLGLSGMINTQWFPLAATCFTVGFILIFHFGIYLSVGGDKRPEIENRNNENKTE
ncbi:MAG: hypothetical protein A2908_03630 [Candidatus Staskawiczbacteria bacterium RIFCSPLOWO2_01_FULL_38_12b]|uniref:Uncharacterized protein n=1 Tax=Candidatus Staskawiczbacteria bacterium RIFCSPLOWO2_01_FULL_38_12b TaxID=1802214 RepID=A0A1G2ID03_9BACT|nr:MAG: hypothetical protein A2908_03630 [Candidatus Staskawiczbacteria bacterium RIFCSPLOWO2_01_FULL_38_12b]